MKRIVRVTPKARPHVELEFSTGEVVDVDFGPIAARGGVFSVLDDEDSFRQVCLGTDGRYTEWPGGVDFCADALYERASSPETAKFEKPGRLTP